MNKAWCISCDPDIATQQWTSRNKNVDGCMKAFQLRTFAYEDVIEWIPFDRLSDVKEIGRGASGSVYSAIWLDGIRKIEKIDNSYTKARKSESIVALKTLPDLKEFDNHMKCNFNLHGSKLKVYGLTQNTKTNEYLLVFQYATDGNLHEFFKKNFQDLTWKIKLKLLIDISDDLYNIHDAEFIHSNLHSGNILQAINKSMQSDLGLLKEKDKLAYISDLGLLKKKDKNDPEGCIYGVMPYIAPEVLSGRPFTKAADIYAFGVIMSEISTGQRPFDGHQFNIEFASMICNGLQPEFAPGTPECYIKLANICMDPDPQKRPDAYEIWETLINMESSNIDKIRKQLLDADRIKTLLPISQSHSDMYTSKIINTQIIAGGLKGYRICESCNQNNTSEAWCQTCDPNKETQGWTSGNENVDNFIKEFQRKALSYTKVIEWIPFDRLDKIRKIGQGGFSSVYLATWLDGMRKIDYVKERYVRTREKSSEVALKTLTNFEKSLSFDEFDNHMRCGLMGIKLKVYGLTYDIKSNEYLMIVQYADSGDLRQFLKSKFKEYTWQTKLKLIVGISEELRHIHNAGYIHGDLHSGNILLDKSMRSYISDLGLSRKVSENISKSDTHGIIPYIAPEVLSGEQHTQKADIYSFGVIMSEISTGKRPFDGYDDSNDLATKICFGLRPGFADGTPDCYVKLAEQCLDSDSQKRPTAYSIYNEINYWLDKIKGSDYENEAIKHKINYWFDKMKVSYAVDKINDCLDKIKYPDNVNEAKKQINNWLDKLKDSDVVDEIKHKINDWLDDMKDPDDVGKIKHKFNGWLNNIKSLVDVGEIKCEINYWLDKIEGSYDVGKIKDWLDEIRVLDDIDKIKHEFNDWFDEIKGSDDSCSN
ncbi:kinase-like domain-containing protein [Gigaspora rosea]|uniref:Kinase-like domain-containing protein n=1 Tax=Gigaspora rosea TaxID=44941 RepID=A0A397VHR9_9GLOM|nr:kinase-like domain-containing protein [Gigaspora rosea]